MLMIRCLLLFLFGFTGTFADAKSWPLTEGQEWVGHSYTVTPKPGDTLSTIGLRYSMGAEEMRRANPMIDPIRPLTNPSQIKIPESFILPNAPHEGIVINLPEYRLYYYPPDKSEVIIMPVGIGRAGWKTPLGVTSITTLSESPVWRPTINVRLEAARNGTPIPNQFPPGPDNPLGQYVLRLGWPTYLIHGTNRPEGVGARVSAGCIRMLPTDIDYLYHNVRVGTPVRVVNQTLKYTRVANKLLVQAYPSVIAEEEELSPAEKLHNIFSSTGGSLTVAIQDKINERSGEVILMPDFFHAD